MPGGLTARFDLLFNTQRTRGLGGLTFGSTQPCSKGGGRLGLSSLVSKQMWGVSSKLLGALPPNSLGLGRVTRADDKEENIPPKSSSMVRSL